MPKYLHQGHWFILTDLKSGYHHVPLHKDSWTYFGVEGQVFVYTHMPFGEASAPGDFTTVIWEVCTPLRQVELCLSSYLDDGLFVAANKGRCFLMAKTMVLLFRALGFLSVVGQMSTRPHSAGQVFGAFSR